MADGQLAHLVRMANQIARNCGEQRNPALAVERTADHLRRFWSPAMREHLARHAKAGGDGLSPAALAACESLA